MKFAQLKSELQYFYDKLVTAWDQLKIVAGANGYVTNLAMAEILTDAGIQLSKKELLLMIKETEVVNIKS